MGFAQSLIEDVEFITDCARFAENLISEQAVRKKYHSSEEAWERLGQDDALVEAIELEKTRRIAARGIAADRDPPAIAVPSARVVSRPPNREHRVFQCRWERMLGRQPIVENDRQ